MEFLIISGMSGAGKSQAADILEDMGYYCVDNMPLALLPRFAELCLASRGRYDHVALVTDVRERESVDGLLPALDGLWDMGLEYRILYIEADVPTIVRRYKSSRRPHPMQEPGGTIDDAVRREASQCIKCAKCVAACPMGLEPYYLSKMTQKKGWDALEEQMITSCIECGCCQASCPSYLPLLDWVRLGKQTVMGIIRARAAAPKK